MCECGPCGGIREIVLYFRFDKMNEFKSFIKFFFQTVEEA